MGRKHFKDKSKKGYLNPACIVKEYRKNLHGMLENYIDHKRLKVFYHKGFACVTCGIVADRLVLWYDNTHNHPSQNIVNGGVSRGLHTDLVAGDRLMTIDHILPRSLGGRDTLENLNPMCDECNGSKGSDFEFVCEVCGDTNYRISKRGNAACNGVCYDYHLVHGHYPSKLAITGE